MHLTMTVIDPRRAAVAPRQVFVEAGSGTRFEDVRPQLAELVGAPGCGFRAEGRTVEDADVLGAPPLMRGALLTVARADEPPPSRAGRGAVELRVVGGFGAGRVSRLGRGRHVVGRAASADVRLDDPGVSRSHVLLDVTTEGVSARDLEPTNRSRLDGTPLPDGGTRLAPGQHLTLGSTTLVLGPPDVRVGYHEVVDGEIQIHRQPRFRDASTPAALTFPEPPTRPDHHRMPLLASLAPVVVSAGLALALSSPALLLFALLSPVMLLGQWWSDRRAGRTSYRRQVRDHADALDRLGSDLERARVDDARSRHDRQPDLGVVEAVVRRRGTRLWERRPQDDDHLLLRVGTAAQPADVRVDGPAPEGIPCTAGLPALVDLGRSGVAGVAGRREHTLSAAGSLVVQAATWHTPRHLGLHVLVGADHHAPDWEWALHLPHVRDEVAGRARLAVGPTGVQRHVAALRDLVAGRLADPGVRVGAEGRRPTDHLVVLDGASAMRSVPGVADLLRDGPRAGVAFLCTDHDITSLPAETQVSLDIRDTGEEAILRADGRCLPEVVPDLPSPGWLEGLSRAMAPCVDATPETGQAALPRVVSFIGLHRAEGLDPSTPEGLVESWGRSTGRPTALLGHTADGPLRLDLSADGPHLLVGGTTGSGKSELLQALVTGLAVTNRPDELALVLVDYKGGSAFSECARLPHTVGLVTDLDAHLTARALTSLDAEMKRRERLLAQASCRDLDDYRRAASVCRELPPLARLVIVVDEFKALADEFPGFITGLVRVAALGRSLGLHLVLATQRPAGIVSADMRANIACRIALRVRDRADSDDVVDAADAASLDPQAPGRACLRVGDRGLTTVQTAYLGRPLPGAGVGPDSARVVVRELTGSPDPSAGRNQPAGPPVGERDDEPGAGAAERPTELHVVVTAAVAAARLLGLEPTSPPWLPALPTEVSASDLSVATGGTDGAPEDEGVALALVDLPAEQRREILRWRHDERGHLGLAGGPRSGRSTALLTLALGIAATADPHDVHVHVLQGAPGPCAGLAPLPCVGTVTDAGDPTLAHRLLSRLLRQVEGSEQGPERTIVLVDGWETVEEALSAIDHGAPVDDLHRLLRDGPASGIRFAVTGGRALLSGRLPGLLQDRLVLHMPDPLDLTLAGVSPSVAATTRPPGRAFDLRSGHELQLALPGTGGPDEAVADLVARAARTRAQAGGNGAGPLPRKPLPWRITPLPERVRAEDLPPADDGLWLGLGGDDAAPTSLPLEDGRRRVLVAGPHRSGRSSALAAIGAGLVARGRRVAVVRPRRSPLSAWATTAGMLQLTHLDADDLIAARRADPDLCVLVDDGELVDGSPVERALTELVRLVDTTEGVIVLAAELSRANGAFRGLVPEVARDGLGVLLGATAPSDGDVLGVRLNPDTVRRPGRGHLVVDGCATAVQVALLEAPSSRPDTPRPTEAGQARAC
ncbi:FtsK/SpoIIIE domain-containing protein [Terrabacter aerolatus]|uniref:Cell division protein FtsK n=1 Tax=Terrabacter aerolatus TaxID=422442 RepID=A0A512D3J9_9MICO|nr:FtsK/SpoIIIE domain-containing protein [Terrabacter aerolatus]GEO31038.1 cell division protein FtsK [Terrabacter aerolatus]